MTRTVTVTVGEMVEKLRTLPEQERRAVVAALQAPDELNDIRKVQERAEREIRRLEHRVETLLIRAEDEPAERSKLVARALHLAVVVVRTLDEDDARDQGRI